MSNCRGTCSRVDGPHGAHRAADGGFDVFLTADQNLQFQQNLAGARLGVVVLAARSTALEDLRPLVPAALDAISKVRKGDVIRVVA